MGDYQYTAIVVTGPSGEADRARKHVTNLFHQHEIIWPIVSPLSITVNDTASFMVAPDGGKLGGTRNLECREIRHLIKEYLSRTNLYWVELTYGELTPAKIVTHTFQKTVPEEEELFTCACMDRRWHRYARGGSHWLFDLFEQGVTHVYSGMEDATVHTRAEATARLYALEMGAEKATHDELVSLRKALHSGDPQKDATT